LDQSYQGFDSKSWSSFLGPLYGNCKDEAAKLRSLAKIIREKGEAEGRKTLAENVWIPRIGWVPRWSTQAKEWQERAKRAWEAIEKAWGALRDKFRKPPSPRGGKGEGTI